ncbi:g5 domain protein [Clostridium sp. CAG:533]|nr:g5 domain protein [Clostridium sp. CAG:533]
MKIRNVLKTAKILIILIVIAVCGQTGIIEQEVKTSNNNLNKTLDLTAMALKIDEINHNDLYYPLDTYNGVLTGYAANCPLCGGTLGCTGQNVLDGTTTYQDKDYGNVKIVASSKSLPCGSIVNFSLNNENITAIVLDRGVTGTALDLLVESESYALSNVGRKNISYQILRFGYNR